METTLGELKNHQSRAPLLFGDSSLLHLVWDTLYIDQQRAAIETFALLEFVRENQQIQSNALKDVMVEVKDNEAKKFLVNLMMKQQKKSSGFKKIPNFSFYKN
jgi:hypothetical protein